MDTFQGFMIYAAYLIIMGLPQFFLGRKHGYERPYFAFIPVLNAVMLIRMADKPIWAIILFFVPVINVLIQIYYMERVVKQYRKGQLTYSIFVICSIVGFIIPFVGIFIVIGSYILFLAFTISNSERFGGYIGNSFI